MPYPALAARTGNIRPFQVMELVKRASAIEAAGRPVIHMSIGEPDFGAAPAVLEALARAVRDTPMQYTSALGLRPLREAIAGFYRSQHGVDVDPSRIVVTAGASAALSLACCALVDPGREVLLTDPGYPCNRHFVAAYDGVARAVPVGPDTRFQMTRALIEQHWNPRTAGALLASPAHPTGTSIPFTELGAIIDAVRARGGFTIVDEIYLGLSYAQPGQPLQRRSALELGDDIIVSNSFSKYFCMTGWRLGWLVVPPALVPVFEKLAQNLFICASTPAQHAALACFEPETLEALESRRREFQRRRDFLVPALRGMGIDVPVMPDGAFYVYADVAAHGGSTRFADALLEREYVSVVPGADFGSFEPERYLRMSYATAYERIEEAVQRIARFIGR